MILTGTTNQNYVPEKVRVTSLIVTSAAGVSAVVHLHDGQDTTTAPKVNFYSVVGITSQITFKGIEFPDGFTVQPDTSTDFYLVEYEPL